MTLTASSPYHHPSDDIPLSPQPLTELEQSKLDHRMTSLYLINQGVEKESVDVQIANATKKHLFQELTNIHNKEQGINESNYRAIYKKNIKAVREGHQQAQARYTHPITISRIQQFCKDLDVRFEESDFKDYVNHKIQSQVVKRYSTKTFDDIIEDRDTNGIYDRDSFCSQIVINDKTTTDNILCVFHEFSHAVQQYITTTTTKNDKKNIFMQKLQQTFGKKDTVDQTLHNYFHGIVSVDYESYTNNQKCMNKRTISRKSFYYVGNRREIHARMAEMRCLLRHEPGQIFTLDDLTRVAQIDWDHFAGKLNLEYFIDTFDGDAGRAKFVDLINTLP